MPTIFNLSEDRAYQAVGLALSRWESMEVVFAGLYSLFVGQPASLQVARDFGDASATFVVRLGRLERAAEAYFTRHCDQDQEGRFASLTERARAASKHRHQIAHGLVQQIQFMEYSTDNTIFLDTYMEWVSLPPWFSEARLGLQGSPGLTVREIEIMSEAFVAIERDTSAYLNELLQR